MADAEGAAIHADGLVKKFAAATAVDHLSFEVFPGEIFGLVGPDGAGKTTTMRMLAGVLSPDAGHATVAGFDVARDCEAVKRHISYMPQRFGLYEDLTVDENIRFYADLFGLSRRERDQHSAQLLEAAGMAEFRARLAGKLSGGMKQKLGLTCALIHRPRVLLLDEPTTGVDPVSRREFWQILYALLGERVTIVISTAYLDEAERCSRLAMLSHGRMLMCDAPAALKTRMPGTLLVIPSPQARAVRDRLADAAGVSSLILVGNAVHLVVDDAPRRIPELRAVLKRQSISFEAITPSEPSIEDLFVACAQTESASREEREHGS
ncbi:MAG TPA: ABC transporter ATP-binding protein [Candidatus Binataceae bacterium]|nr:ABC transporter ATP-binding protein [Candidatus Binataceae bacterium]